MGELWPTEVTRRSIEYVDLTGKWDSDPRVETLEFNYLFAEKPLRWGKSVLIGPMSDSPVRFLGPIRSNFFSLHYINNILVDAIFEPLHKKFSASIRIVPSALKGKVRIQTGLGRFVTHRLSEEYELVEECITQEVQAGLKEVAVPHAWEYRGASTLVDEKAGTIYVTVTYPESIEEYADIEKSEVSFPIKLDDRCEAFFELANRDWHNALQLFRISWKDHFKLPRQP